MLLIAFQIFGLYGGMFQPIRVITILFSPFFIAGSLKSDFFKYYKFELYFFYIFFLSALISTFYAYDLDSTIKGVFYVGFNSLLFFTIIFLAFKSLNPKIAIVHGWILFFIFSVPIAFFEIFYDYHLSSSVIEEGTLIGVIGELKVYATVTFGNYNLYNVLLVFVFPFLTANMLIQKSVYIKMFNLFLILSLCFIIITNASRGGFLCISIGIIYFVFKYFQLVPTNKNYAFLILAGIFSLLIIYGNSLFSMIFYRLENVGYTDTSRNEIYSNGLKMLLDYNFFGVGSGNFQAVMNEKYNIEITAPHNMFLEILVEYGIFIFIGFLVLISRIYYRSKDSDVISNYIVFLGFLTLPIAAIINSAYAEGVNMWVYLASLLIISDERFLKLKLSNNE